MGTKLRLEMKSIHREWSNSVILQLSDTLGAAWEDFHSIAAHASGLHQQTEPQEIIIAEIMA